MPPRRRRDYSPPKGPGRATPHVQRGIVELHGNSKYRIEKPKPKPKWIRDISTGRLVSNLPRRPNVGGQGDLEVFYHVERKEGEVLPPPQTLWRQRYGDQQTISYRPLWVPIARNLTSPLRRRSDVSSSEKNYDGNVGLPYLYTYDETAELDEFGYQYTTWRPLQIIANGGYGVVITYVDDSRDFTGGTDIPDEDIKVAKFNYKGGDLEDIMGSLVNQISISEQLRRRARPLEEEDEELDDDEDDDEGAADSQPPAASRPRVAKRAARRAARKAVKRARKAARKAEIEESDSTSEESDSVSEENDSVSDREGSSSTVGPSIFSAGTQRRSSDDDSRGSSYSHFQTPTPGLDVDTTDTFRMETQVLEVLDMTGSPHFPKFWKLADPPQDGTLCTMEYIPGGKTLDEQFDLLWNEKTPIRLVWEAVLCLSKAMSVMAYGSEDPAPTHRVHGWNQIVHLDWSVYNIFVRKDVPSHTCSHGTCFIVGDFGFALIVPNRRRARAAFREEHLKFGWHRNLNPRLPEAQIDTKRPLQYRIDQPVIGHFSYKTNIFLMALVWSENLGGDQIGKIGIMRYAQDNLTPLEQAEVARDLETYVPLARRLGEPLEDVDDDDEDEDEGDYAPRVRGYVDVANFLLAEPIPQNLRVSEQRFANLMQRCLSEDPDERPEIEEIMLSAARGMAEAGAYVPPPPESSDESIDDSEDGEDKA